MRRHLLVLMLPLKRDLGMLMELLRQRWVRKKLQRPYGLRRRLVVDMLAPTMVLEMLGHRLLIIRAVAKM